MRSTKYLLLLTSLFLLFPAALFSSNQIDLSGEWSFRTGSYEDEFYSGKLFEEEVKLPGSMPENHKGYIPDLKTQWTCSIYDSSFYYSPLYAKFREPGNVKFTFFLTPERHYVGVAWYNKEVEIPESWKEKHIELFMERVHTESSVFVDGIKAGTENSLCVPHVYDLSKYLTPGKHTISLRIDNRIKSVNVGKDSHSITDQTQGNWNGVVGKIELIEKENVYFDNIQVFPDIHKKTALVRFTIKNKTGKARKYNIYADAVSFNCNELYKTETVKRKISIPEGRSEFDMELPVGDKMQLWSEFSPAMYKLSIGIYKGKKVIDTASVNFGMREIKTEGKWFYVNGRKTMLRGTVENCCFPNTGYPPMDIASWVKVFNKCKSYGLNHMRFHSYCPPKAAFEAADLTGFYLQPEGPSWPNHGSALGYGAPIDMYLMLETMRMDSIYGNHPSFTMLSAGNEPRGRWVKWVTGFVNYWRKTDSRRVYTGASVGGSWAWQPANQYHVKAGARGLNWSYVEPETMSDFRKKIDTVSVPFVSHETGQWCVFPDFSEIKKYTGVNKAKNFEAFKEILADHDMAGMGHDFMMASGKLQLLCYKHEIEKILRTPDYAGFQLLSLNDYSGQGTALVGVLNVFWQEKGYCDSSDFKKFCSRVVPLIRTKKFVYKSNETLHASAELAYFGEKGTQAIKPTWILKDKKGNIVKKGSFGERIVFTGNNIPLGDIDIDFGFVDKPSEFNLEIRMNTCEGDNDWNFYVYPVHKKSPDKGSVAVFDSWNRKVKKELDEGRNVLLLAAGKIEYGKDIVQTLTPVFWNTSWFKMRPPHTTGILVNPDSPVFKDFPTDYYEGLQWWEITNRAQVMNLSEFPKGFQPVIQSIDTWFLSRKIGMLIEAKVGKGRLMVCSADLHTNLKHRPVADQLYRSILNYMNSDKFNPEYTVDVNVIGNLFTKESDRVNMFTTDAPDEIKNKKK